MRSQNQIKLFSLTALAAASFMTLNASAAQAKFLLLLNKTSVTSLNLKFTQVGNSYFHAENGLKLHCEGGSGTITAKSSGSGEKVTGTFFAKLTKCTWVNQELFCTINDGVKGEISPSATGELTISGSNWIYTITNPNFVTVFTFGPLCTIPEEEVLSGSAHFLIENALSDAKSKSGIALTLSLKLGLSKVDAMVGTLSIADENSSATYGFHLANLPGCSPIC